MQVPEVEGMARGRKVAAAVVLSLMMVPFVNGGPIPPLEGAASKVFSMGFAGPFTGPAAESGTNMKDAALLALDGIGSTVGPYKIDPTWIDEQSDPVKSTQAFEEAVTNKHIQMGCLEWHSSDAVAMMDVAAKYQIPFLFAMGATEIVNEKFKKDPQKYGYWLKGWPVPGNLATPYVDALEQFIASGAYKPAHGKKVALWSEETDWGHSLADALNGAFVRHGWQVAAKEFFPINQTDHHAMLTKFKNLGVSVIAGTATAPQAMSALLKQRSEVGLDAVVVADGVGYIGNFYQLTGPASDYVLDMQPLFASTKAQAFVTKFKTRFGVDPSPTSGGVAYDWANFCIKVLQRTLQEYGDLTSANIYKVERDEVETGKLTYGDGIMMKEYKFTPQSVPDPLIGTDAFIFPVIQYFSGKPLIVFPAAQKTAVFKAPQ